MARGLKGQRNGHRIIGWVLVPTVPFDLFEPELPDVPDLLSLPYRLTIQFLLASWQGPGLARIQRCIVPTHRKFT